MALGGFGDILRDELNVREVEFVEEAGAALTDFGITRRLTVNARALGPRIGKEVQRVIGAAKAGDWQQTGDTVTAGGVELLSTEFELTMEAADATRAIAFLPTGGFVLLDTATTPELEAEGFARDLVRAIQDARKSAGLEVSDRIELELSFASESEHASVAGATQLIDLISGETLATSIRTRFVVPADLDVVVAASGSAGAFRASIPAGRYSNVEPIIIEFQVAGRGIDV